MAKIHRTILFVTFIISCLSSVFHITSISTNNWIDASAIYMPLSYKNDVSYGLFGGSLYRQVLATTYKLDLSVVCDYNEGACIYSCQSDSETRQEELRRILDGNDLEPCPTQLGTNPTKAIGSNKRIEDSVDHRKQELMPAGLWLCTVFFLSIAILFSVAAAGFSLINLIFSPVEPILNVFGIVIWNGISAISSLIVLILWGNLFDKYLSHNIAISDTLLLTVTFSSDGKASIGYSYYMVLLACLSNLVNIGLLVLRTYFLNHEAQPSTIKIETSDSSLDFY